MYKRPTWHRYVFIVKILSLILSIESSWPLVQASSGIIVQFVDSDWNMNPLVIGGVTTATSWFVAELPAACCASAESPAFFVLLPDGAMVEFLHRTACSAQWVALSKLEAWEPVVNVDCSAAGQKHWQFLRHWWQSLHRIWAAECFSDATSDVTCDGVASQAELGLIVQQSLACPPSLELDYLYYLIRHSLLQYFSML